MKTKAYFLSENLENFFQRYLFIYLVISFWKNIAGNKKEKLWNQSIERKKEKSWVHHPSTLVHWSVLLGPSFMTRIWNFVAALVQDVNGDESQEILAAPSPSPSSDYQIFKPKKRQNKTSNWYIKTIPKCISSFFFFFFEVGD